MGSCHCIHVNVKHSKVIKIHLKPPKSNKLYDSLVSVPMLGNSLNFQKCVFQPWTGVWNVLPANGKTTFYLSLYILPFPLNTLHSYLITFGKGRNRSEFLFGLKFGNTACVSNTVLSIHLEYLVLCTSDEDGHSQSWLTYGGG